MLRPLLRKKVVRSSHGRLIYIGFKFSQMGKYSGYDMIRNYVAYDHCFQLWSGWLQPTWNGKGSLFARIYARIFGRRLWWGEVYAFFCAIMYKECVIHFAYPENTVRYSRFLKSLGAKVVFTLHQPSSFYDKPLIRERFISIPNQLIVLSDAEREKLVSANKCVPIVYIPHGIDVSFFKSDGRIRGRQVLLVGNWLRDFSFASKVFARLEEVDPTIRAIVVSSQKNSVNFANNANVTFLSGLSDDDLVKCYNDAAVLYLPLTKYVANNAVLEAAACGCSVVISSDNNRSTYSDSPIICMSSSIDSVVSTLIVEVDKNRKENAQCRDWVTNNFSWTVIGQKTEALLRSV